MSLGCIKLFYLNYIRKEFDLSMDLGLCFLSFCSALLLNRNNEKILECSLFLC